jgi:hypothetical protein
MIGVGADLLMKRIDRIETFMSSSGFELKLFDYWWGVPSHSQSALPGRNNLVLRFNLRGAITLCSECSHRPGRAVPGMPPQFEVVPQPVRSNRAGPAMAGTRGAVAHHLAPIPMPQRSLCPEGVR